MKRHYTDTDIAVLQAISRPGWWELEASEDISLMAIHASLCRLVTDKLVILRWVDNELSAHRQIWPASLSRIVAA